MKQLSLVCAALTLAIGAPATVNAQALTPLQLEVRGGAGLPTGDFADVAKAGWNVGANISYMVTPVVGVYAGYSYGSFPLKDGIFDEDFTAGQATLDVDATESGFSFGALARLADAPLAPWARGGLVYNQFGFKVSGGGSGSGSFNSDRSLGFEVGGGIAVPVAPRISLTPGISYRSFKPKLDGENSDQAISDVTVDVGVRINL